MDRPSKKLDDKRFGPFKVIKKVSPATYKLKLPNLWKGKSPVFNKTYLTKFHEPIYQQQKKPPPLPPVKIEEGEKEWQVEKIVDSRVFCGWLQYLVHWKGYA
jgi:hypothetical protein